MLAEQLVGSRPILRVRRRGKKNVPQLAENGASY